MSATKYTVKFNELSCFAPAQEATKEMRIDHFKQGPKGSTKQMVAGHAYANFQEMFQSVVTVSRVMHETEVENRDMGRPKRRFGPGRSSS